MTNESSGSCCSTNIANPAVDASRVNLLAGGNDVASEADITTCPVMVGSAVNKTKAEAAGLFRDFEGERYFFCCAGCAPKFDADPAAYAANMA